MGISHNGIITTAAAAVIIGWLFSSAHIFHFHCATCSHLFLLVIRLCVPFIKLSIHLWNRPSRGLPNSLWCYLSKTDLGKTDIVLASGRIQRAFEDLLAFRLNCFPSFWFISPLRVMCGLLRRSTLQKGPGAPQLTLLFRVSGLWRPRAAYANL